MKRFTKKRLCLFQRTISKFWKTFRQNRAYQVTITITSIPYIVWQLLVPVIPLGRYADRVSEVSRMILEKRRTTHLVGFQIASLLVFFSLVPFTHIQATSFPAAQETVLTAPEMKITTEETFQMPVPGYVSQSYNWHHHGIDIAGNNGVEVYPIANGTVREIAYSPLGYGLQVVLDHGNGIISRYAHLQVENVELNQTITKSDVLGLVGSTGWSTGPHLHLEVYQNHRSVNPFAYVPPKYDEAIKVVASNNKTILTKWSVTVAKVASVSAGVEFKEIATGFNDPNWYTEASVSASARTAQATDALSE